MSEIRVGEIVNVDGYTAPVAELFQSVPRQTESAGLPDLRKGTIYFCFSTQAGVAPLLVRWNEEGINFYRGKFLTAKELSATFRSPSGD